MYRRHERTVISSSARVLLGVAADSVLLWGNLGILSVAPLEVNTTSCAYWYICFYYNSLTIILH